MRGNKIRVPRDVEAYINRKRTARVTILMLVETVLITLAVLFGNDIFGGDHPAVSYVIFGVMMILPVFLLDLPFWLFDKTWAGELIAKSEEEYVGIDENKSVRTGSLQLKKMQTLKIRLDCGKIIEYKIYDDRARHAFRNSTYNVGDRIVHVGGTRYVQAVAVNGYDTLICVICGSESRADTPSCHVCGKTLKID